MPFDGASLKPDQQLLLDAAEVLEKNKWWRPANSASKRPAGAHCVLTAIYAAHCQTVRRSPGDGRFPTSAHMTAMNRLEAYLKLGFAEIADWNDTKSKEEVVAALRAAAMMEVNDAV